MTTFKNGPAHGVTLCFLRAPLLLRVVDNGKGFDCLNEIEDTPEMGEEISVYRMTAKMGVVHVDGTFGGRRQGLWYTKADYEWVGMVKEDIRDRQDWEKWCCQYAAENPTLIFSE